jgi:hypothetical protein
LEPHTFERLPRGGRGIHQKPVTQARRPRKQKARLVISVHGDLSLSMAQWRVLHRECQNQGRRD